MQEGKNETERRRRRRATLPCGCALPHIADAAFERLGGVPEGAHATVPVSVVRGLLGLSFWPVGIKIIIKKKNVKNVKVKLVCQTPPYAGRFHQLTQKGKGDHKNKVCNSRGA